MMDDPSYFERQCEHCGDEAIGMSGLCHLCHESAEAKAKTQAELEAALEALRGSENARS